MALRILHVVTLVDDRASYGGPLTVALGHCTELRRRGHEPLLVAGWRGVGSPPTLLEGVPARLFPVRPMVPGLRFASLYSASMHAWLLRHAKDFDVAHLHLARDLVPLVAASVLRRAGVPYLVQTHGMIRPDARLSAKVIDRLATVPTMKAAARLLSLTTTEDGDVTRVAGDGRAPTRLRNGIDVRSAVEHPEDDSGRPLDVLFLARLHPRKRVLAFAEAAEVLIAGGVAADFSVVGPDDGDLPKLSEFIKARPTLNGRLRYEGALRHEDAVDRLRRADVYVLPSVNEPYPMSVLEALAAGVPVICTDNCGLAPSLREMGAAEVVSSTQDGLVTGLRRVLTDPAYRGRLTCRAREAAGEEFSLPAVISDLEQHYEGARTEASAAQGPGLVWVTNLATPYRLPLWRELAQRIDLTVALLARTEPNRNWRIDLRGEPFRVQYLDARVLRSSGDATFYGSSRPLHQLISRRPAALVVDGWESPAYLLAAWHAKRAGVPLIASYRSTRQTHRFSSGPVAAVRSRFLRSADRVLTAGADSSAAVREMGVPGDRIDVGFNTVDVKAFANGASLARIGMSTRTSHAFLYAGQLIPRKNVAGLVESFAQIRDEGDTLSIVGTGSLESEIREQCRRLSISDAVTFTGHLEGDALISAYAESDTLVLPSTEEVWGLVVNEALAAGLHIVVSDACGAASSIENMPGVWVTKPTIEGLTSAMTASRQAWTGPIPDHPVCQHTPAALATIILDAVARASETVRRNS